MPPPTRITSTLVKVLDIFLDDPDAERFGMDIMRATGFPSGTVYPILTRLLSAGWLDAHWEQIDPVREGRPARRWYRLTALGVRSAQAELAAYRRRHAPRRGAANARPTWES